MNATKVEAIFDKAADSYDLEFTYSHTGKMQRLNVWKFLENHVFDESVKKVLELNCGTGEDALFMAKNKMDILATDISPQMIACARKKVADEVIQNKPLFEVMGIQESLEKLQSERFDLIFSNFGGFNCLDEKDLTSTMQNASKLLKSKGFFLITLMPKFCLQESVYFLLKGNKEQAFRRSQKKGSLAKIKGEKLQTYYYNPGFFKQFSQYEVKRTMPLGFFLPPSYLEGFFQPKKVLMKTLFHLENGVKALGFLSKWSDHYVILLQKK